MTVPTYVQLTSPVTVAADLERRVIEGLAVPWETAARVSTGQLVSFAAGSLTGEHVVLNLDHDPRHPIGVAQDLTDTPAGLQARFRIPATAAGDLALLEAAEGLRSGLSVGADIIDADEGADGSIYVTAGRLRHVALLSEPAYPDARVSRVAAAPPEAPTMSDTPTPDPVDPEPEPDEVTPTRAGVVAAQAGALGVAAAGGALVRDPYPYWPGGPHSMLRDAFESREGDVEAAARIQKAMQLNRDPALMRRAVIAMAERLAVRAATGTTITHDAITPPGYRPDLYTPLIGYEAPVYSACTKSPIANFDPFTIPHELGRTGLSGTPADEVTPVAAGDITTSVDTVTPQQVMGKYQFSRALAMSANPAIDQIAQNALNEEWLKDIETRAVTFFTTAANSSAQAATYADGVTFVAGIRKAMAAQRTARHAPTRTVIAPVKEYLAAVGADDANKRPLLGWDGVSNTYGPGTVSDAAAEAHVLGVPVFPGGAAPIPANKVLFLAGGDAHVFLTPIMNFRFDADATNPMVITLVKYSGVAFWTRFLAGVVLTTNTTPLALEAGDQGFDDEPAKTRK